MENQPRWDSSVGEKSARNAHAFQPSLTLTRRGGEEEEDEDDNDDEKETKEW